jgi:hypothetical protein
VTVNASDKGIELRWINSSSTDVERHLLYRRPVGKPEWEPLLLSKGLIPSYGTWTSIRDKTTYEYTLIAEDESGLRSEPAKQ